MYARFVDTADRNRVTAQCASFAQDEVDGLLLLELVDVTSANEAIWAHIVKGRTERSIVNTQIHVWIGGSRHTVQVIPSVKYYRDRKVSDRVILYHEGLTRFRYDYLLNGSDDEPSPWFMTALQQRLPIPVLSHWANSLWITACDWKLIKRVELCYGGANLWKLRASDDYLPTWSRMISQMIKTKKLSATERI